MKSTASSSLRTDAHREIRVARSSGEWAASGVVVPLKARKSPFGSKPTPNQRPRVVSMCATRWQCVTGVTSRAVVWPRPGTWIPIHRHAGWETAWQCSGSGSSLHENSPSFAVAVMALSPVSCAQVPTITSWGPAHPPCHGGVRAGRVTSMHGKSAGGVYRIPLFLDGIRGGLGVA